MAYSWERWNSDRETARNPAAAIETANQAPCYETEHSPIILAHEALRTSDKIILLHLRLWTFEYFRIERCTYVHSPNDLVQKKKKKERERERKGKIWRIWTMWVWVTTSCISLTMRISPILRIYQKLMVVKQSAVKPKLQALFIHLMMMTLLKKLPLIFTNSHVTRLLFNTPHFVLESISRWHIDWTWDIFDIGRSRYGVLGSVARHIDPKRYRKFKQEISMVDPW